MSSRPVFATNIRMIFKWGKNTKSTKTSLLIDYLWEEQAILKRKRISFEDIVYKSGLCSSCSINGVLAGSHYNRVWIVHSGTIYYLRLLSHAIYHCAVVAQWIKSSIRTWMLSHVYVDIFCHISGAEMELGSLKSPKSSWCYITSVDLFSFPAVSKIWFWFQAKCFWSKLSIFYL